MDVDDEPAGPPAPHWIELDGLVNLRDVGGLPTEDGGRIHPGRLLRSDNLQDLTPSDIDELLGLGLTDVIDLRSDFEVAAEGDGPLRHHPDVRFHHFSYFQEPDASARQADDGGAELPEGSEAQLPAAVLPWVGLAPAVEVADFHASTYLSFLADRPDSVLAALRAIAHADGAALVHCAAGKDRTGTTVALALSVAGVRTEAIVADYAASNLRIAQIIDRLLTSPTYHDNLAGRPLSTHASEPETMAAFLAHVADRYGGVVEMLSTLGWRADDTAALRAKLLGLRA